MDAGGLEAAVATWVGAKAEAEAEADAKADADPDVTIQLGLLGVPTQLNAGLVGKPVQWSP